ncbi:MAG: hypothetical protein DSZ06_01950 [Sulfurospirillum sp.]|nr:MAG: hypothetical protein DSZ06_01950 [Sulfurospirillum sp.]
MQMVKKSLGIIFAVWFTLLLFMPKEEMYYKVEKILAAQDITLNEKSIESGVFSLNIKDVTVYAKGIALAHIDEIDFFTLLVYNTLRVDNLVVDEVLQSKVPAQTKEAVLTHQIFSPLTVSVDANGTFGYVEGSIDLSSKQVHIDFVKEKEIEMIKPFLQKGKKGWFYEKSF